MGEIKKPVLDEHIEKLKYRFGYQINETPKYKQVIDDSMEFDDVPAEVNGTLDGQPMPNAGGGTDAYLEEQGQEVPPKPDEEVPVEDVPSSEETPVPEPTNAPIPDTGDVPMPEDPTAGEEIPSETPMDVEQPPVETPTPNPEKEVNQIQNDIIRHNIEAMKSLQNKLEDLENVNLQLNSQLEVLNAQVEEVKEPTDGEKLMKKKNVSYPFYFNLNDFWQGNWFDQQRQQAQEGGIRELPDGTFVADFDDLPTHNSMDIDNSFNTIV